MAPQPTGSDIRHLLDKAVASCPPENFSSPLNRFIWKDKEWPQFTAAIDGVPIFCRGDAEHFNGKHKGKYVSFQVLVDLVGRPWAWSPGVPGKVHDSKAFEEWSVIKEEHVNSEFWFADTAYIACSHCVTPLKSNMKTTFGGITATDDEKDLFEILHRKRRNRVEHFFAKLNCFNFKYSGCDLRSKSIPKFFNLLMHVISCSMTETIGDTDTWPYCGTVSLRPVGEISQFLQYCSCQMKDKVATRLTRDKHVRHMADAYRGRVVHNKRSAKGKKSGPILYVPRTRRQLYKKFVATMEDSGSKWVLMKAAKELKKATKAAAKIAALPTPNEGAPSAPTANQRKPAPKRAPKAKPKTAATKAAPKVSYVKVVEPVVPGVAPLGYSYVYFPKEE